MAGYEDTRQLIIDTLMNRPAGTEIQPENHQEFALAITDYVRSVELSAGNAFIGFAQADTVPIQSDNGQCFYISTVPPNTNIVYANFIDSEGNPISVTTPSGKMAFVTLIWNTRNWDAQITIIETNWSQVLEDNIASGAVTGPKIAPNSIGTSKIIDGTIQSNDLNPNAFDDTLTIPGKIAPADVVGSKLTELSAEIESNIGVSSVKKMLTKTGFINISGNVQYSGDGWLHSEFIPIEYFVSARLNGNYGGSTLVSSVAFYSSANYDSFINGLTEYDSNAHVVGVNNITIPNNAKYVVISAKDSISPYYVVSASMVADELSATQNDVKNIQNDVKDLQDGLQFEYPFEKSGWVRLTNGEIVPSATWNRTTFIPVDCFVKAYIYGHNSVASFAYYSDANDDAFLGGETFGAEWVEKSLDALTLPTNTKYIVVSQESGMKPFDDGYVNGNRLCAIQNIQKETQAEVVTTKMAYFSFDDVYYVLDDLTINQNAYTSIFDNPFLGRLKKIHEQYGIKFSFFVFYSYIRQDSTVWRLSETTTKFASEFAKNWEWLRWGVHTINAYPSCISSLINIVGSPYAIDLIPRADGFAGTLDMCKAARDSQCGALGFLAPDDERNGYYLDAETSALVYKRGKYFDPENQLFFFRSLTRIEYQNPVVTLNSLQTATAFNLANNAVLFTHEYEVYNENGVDENIYQMIVSACQWARNNGYKWGYLMDKIRKAW